MVLFPVCVHKDEDSAFGVTIPDIAGCFTAGATLDEAIANVQEAVETHLDEGDAPPEPTSLEALLSDPVCDGGTWVLVDIDLSFLKPRIMRVNITLPEHVLRKIDRQAAEMNLSRSAFIIQAATAAETRRKQKARKAG